MPGSGSRRPGKPPGRPGSIRSVETATRARRLRGDQLGLERVIRIETGIFPSVALGLSVFNTISPATVPVAEPGGTFTVMRYRPLSLDFSSRATDTSSGAG